MHELGLCQGILDAVLRRAQGRRVVGVRVRAGVLQHLSQDSVAAAFGLLAEGTEAAGADVDLVLVPAQLACRDCGCSISIDEPHMVCPLCGSGAVETAGGEEVILESIELAPTGAREEASHVPRRSGPGG